MNALEAARLGDQIGHTSAMKGLLAGLVAGFVITGLVLLAAGATIATGGAAAVVIGALIAGTCAGGLTGMKIGATFDSDPKGPIITGSPDTFLGTSARPAARAIRDMVQCEDHEIKPIAQGSLNVFINKAPAARHTDGTVCSAKIREGQPDVFFGGPTGTYLAMESEVPHWLVVTLEVGVWVGAAIATGGAIFTVGIGAALGGLALGIAGSWVGGKIGGAIGGLFGARGAIIGEAIGSFAGGLAGGVLGAKLGGGAEGAIRSANASAAATDFINNTVPNLDFTPPAGQDPAFWTGKGAMDAAGNDGFARMEDTPGGKATSDFVDTIKPDSGWDTQKPVWNASSDGYANRIGELYGTGGPYEGQPVRAYISDQANPNSVYYTTEKPILQSYGVNIQEVPVSTAPPTPP